MTVAAVSRGHGLLESVRWHAGIAYAADWLRGEILAYAADGTEDVVLRHPSMPLCFDFAPDGALTLVSNSAQQVLRVGDDGELRPWADLRGLALGGWNEIVFDAIGGAYVNCGNFDPRHGFPTTPVGLVVRVEPDGRVRVVADGLAFPNGMALADTEFLVAESHAGRLTAYRIDTDGSLGESRVWAETPGFAPDGISLAADGSCWFADVGNSCVIRVAEGGELRQRIDLDRGAFSCALNGSGDELYIAAAHWPGGARLMDPEWEWDGTLYRVLVGAESGGWASRSRSA